MEEQQGGKELAVRFSSFAIKHMMNFPVCLRGFLSLGDPNRGLKGYFASLEHTRDELIILTIVYLLCNVDVLSFFC